MISTYRGRCPMRTIPGSHLNLAWPSPHNTLLWPYGLDKIGPTGYHRRVSWNYCHFCVGSFISSTRSELQHLYEKPTTKNNKRAHGGTDPPQRNQRHRYSTIVVDLGTHNLLKHLRYAPYIQQSSTKYSTMV